MQHKVASPPTTPPTAIRYVVVKTATVGADPYFELSWRRSGLSALPVRGRPSSVHYGSEHGRGDGGKSKKSHDPSEPVAFLAPPASNTLHASSSVHTLPERGDSLIRNGQEPGSDISDCALIGLRHARIAEERPSCRLRRLRRSQVSLISESADEWNAERRSGHEAVPRWSDLRHRRGQRPLEPRSAAVEMGEPLPCVVRRGRRQDRVSEVPAAPLRRPAHVPQSSDEWNRRRR